MGPINFHIIPRTEILSRNYLIKNERSIAETPIRETRRRENPADSYTQKSLRFSLNVCRARDNQRAIEPRCPPCQDRKCRKRIPAREASKARENRSAAH